MISKQWGEIYSDHLEYDLPQDKGDKSNPITLQQYLAKTTEKTGKCAGDKLLHTIFCDNDPINVNLMYFTHYKVETNQVLNGLPYILSEELLVNPNYFITRSGI